jgi:tetratricopeptide (TPR) repeat protein
MRGLTPLVMLGLAAGPLAAQGSSVANEIRTGDSLHTALRPDQALARYRAALALDSTNYETLWKAAREAVDVAKQIEGKADSLHRRRDSLYVEARTLAEAAVRARPNGASGHSMIAQALGRLSRTRGGRERVRFARIIYDEAVQAIALDSTDDAAHHVLGAWHAEVRRLSGFQRFFAQMLFGAGFLRKANWDDAQRHLVRAVALNPANIFHHLELAQVYVDLGKYSAAREQLTAIHDLPIADVLDHEYKNEAATLLDGLKNHTDET